MPLQRNLILTANARLPHLACAGEVQAGAEGADAAAELEHATAAEQVRPLQHPLRQPEAGRPEVAAGAALQHVL